MVECSPVTQAARVRFPADADIYERRLGRDIPNGRPSQPCSYPPPLPGSNGADGRAIIRHHVKMLLKDTHDEQDQTIHCNVSEIQPWRTRINYK